MISTQSGFSYKTSVAYNSKVPKLKSVNKHIRTSDVPAINRYKFDQYEGVPKVRFEKKKYYYQNKEMNNSDHATIVLPKSNNISKSVIEREITRGTQKGYKSCLSGPHRPLNVELPPNTGKSIGFMTERNKSVKFNKVTPEKYNIAGSTYHGGWKQVVDKLGRDLDGRDRTAMTGFGNVIKTNSKAYGSNRGGHVAGNYERRVKSGI
jgi:hypothetical protein